MSDEGSGDPVIIIDEVVPVDLTIKGVLIDSALYSTAKISGDFARALLMTYVFDTYCVYCDKDSTFREITAYTGTPSEEFSMQPRFFSKNPKCTRNPKHSYVFYMLLDADGMLSKIGQFPSLEDITGSELRKYKNQLRGGYFQELTRANGLISHGIGIGSFVYLRRIFEKLIEDHRAEFEKEGGLIDGFDTLRIDDKINVLKSVLPPALVKNRATYSILSSGIHALSEDDCRLYFPVVKAAIIQILEQDFEARQRLKNEQELEAAIAEIQGKLKKPVA